MNVPHLVISAGSTLDSGEDTDTNTQKTSSCKGSQQGIAGDQGKHITYHSGNGLNTGDDRLHTSHYSFFHKKLSFLNNLLLSHKPRCCRLPIRAAAAWNCVTTSIFKKLVSENLCHIHLIFQNGEIIPVIDTELYPEPLQGISTSLALQLRLIDCNFILCLQIRMYLP